tara:strand:+ start:288 stop:602 length:315 start_codon:yes stop_codon:yes gene_type:complete
MGGLFGSSKPRDDTARQEAEANLSGEEARVRQEERQEAQKVAAQKRARTTGGRRQLMEKLTVEEGQTFNRTTNTPTKKSLGSGRNPRSGSAQRGLMSRSYSRPS